MAKINLASNENPLGPSPKAVAAIREAAELSHLYPDNDACQLRKKLAEHHSLSEDQILLAAGSTDLITILARTLLGPGRNAITSERSFIVYGMAARDAGAELVETKMVENSFDLDAIAASINSSTRLVLLANPNNPTGSLFDAMATDEFLVRVPDDVTVVLDEAYYEYADFFAQKRQTNYSHSLDYVREKRNVVVLRTFSKAHGLAGLRIGYALGHPNLLNSCAVRRNTFSISRPAQDGALAALDDQSHISKTVENNAKEADRLSCELTKLGLRVAPTWANFLHCEMSSDAAALARRLDEAEIAVRPLNDWGAPNAIRITIGTREQNQALVRAMRTVLNSR